MSDDRVTFDQMRTLAAGLGRPDAGIDSASVYLVRDLYGVLRLVAHEALEADQRQYDALVRASVALDSRLGARSGGLVFVDSEALDLLEGDSQELASGWRWVDRLITGRDWSTVEPRDAGPARRITLFSIKGGVGRTTTAAVMAAHLARRGERVLIVDLDLESPGLSSAMLERRIQPAFGVTDWFIEDLVGQTDIVVPDVVGFPRWADDMDGDVLVAPAYGRAPGEYLAKLGRVYMGDNWAGRLRQLLLDLETHWEPTVTLIESRSGLHDIGAATVTDAGADVLLFAMDSANHWDNYALLFGHWQSRGLAPHIRERLSIVSALTPVNEQTAYLASFRERSWDLFRDHLYDTVLEDSSGSEFSFNLDDDDAPHAPMPIYWTLGLATGGSLLDVDETRMGGAYARFLSRFETFTGPEEEV